MTAIRGCLLGLAAAALAFSAAEAATITDSAGRVVEIPDTVERVYPAGPPAAVLLYTVKPEAMVGWVRPLRDIDMPFLIESVRGLPTVGRLTSGGDNVNLEVLVAADPDLILDFGTIDQGYVDLANRVQEQSGIPYVLIDGSFETTPEALRLVGRILGVPDRGETLATHVEEAFAEVDAVLAKVAEDQRPRVYLARGPDGLQSGARGSINTAIIERAGGVNVVDAAGNGLVTVSPEQVIAWAPDTIVTLDRGFAGSVGTAAAWQQVPAVARNRVFLAADTPFGFIDTPPSVNRVVGLYWMLDRFYPEQASGNLREEVREFYDLFYHRAPTDAELDALLGN